MTKWKYIKVGGAMRIVMKDGVKVGCLHQSKRRTTGLHSERITTWSGTIDGREISASTITAAKARIER
jgi:hypothetical protein